MDIINSLSAKGITHAVIAIACGTTRSAVHSWANGGEMSGPSVVALGLFDDLVNAWGQRGWTIHSLEESIKIGGIKEAHQHLF